MLKDNDMRAVLINELNRANTCDYRVIEELAVCDGDARVDVPAKFNCDEDVYAAVNDFLNNVRTKSVIERLQMLGKNADSYDLDKIYISKKLQAQGRL